MIGDAVPRRECSGIGLVNRVLGSLRVTGSHQDGAVDVVPRRDIEVVEGSSFGLNRRSLRWVSLLTDGYAHARHCLHVP